MTNAHMTLEQARAVTRTEIVVGQSYTFYSDCVGCESDGGELIRRYSGQSVTVLALDPDAFDEGESEPAYKVHAANGDTFTAHEGELNGWIFDTGQWVGPRVN
jgi:hypothetical protein